MQSDELKRRISAGRGDALADLVLRNARIVNVIQVKILQVNGQLVIKK